ncbi:MAG: hypothetical protein IPI93_13915 [Sphingobacteriaceae bacterium]|nr:hypothetical protein [Sphingobacteriaceae bacterium]
MKNVVISLLSNAILLVLVVISIISFWNGYLSWKDLLVLQVIMGAAYVFLSCYQFTNVSYRADVPKERYAYFPHSFYMFRALKIFLFVSFALMLISSGTRIKYLYPICLIIALTEFCVGALKVYRKLCFVSIYANYILFSKNIMYQVFASDIESVRFRHGILYIIQKNGRTNDLRLVHIDKKKEFLAEIKEWLEKNKISLNPESKQLFDEFYQQI